jgi:23S rRNA (adenine2503-C2)-methyltransferase
MKEHLLSLDLPGLEAYVANLGHPRFRARQLFQWLHAKGVFRADRMSNLPAALRNELSPLLASFPVEWDGILTSRDGTRKVRFLLQDGGRVESVLIPGKNRSTLCVSTQLGCRMGCLFCRTGRMGWVRNLEVGEILGQIYAVRGRLAPEDPVLTHVVFMGMGEPLDNPEGTLQALRVLTHPLGGCLSTRRVTVSTVGIPGEMERLLREVPVAITVSLNAADETTRSFLMPVNRRYPLTDLCASLRGLPLPPRRRITIAYVLIRGVNDRPEDARQLARLLHGVRCKVNLIPLNPFPGSDLRAPEESVVLSFQERLRSRGVSAHVRFSRGEDILAACGQLADVPASG